MNNHRVTEAQRSEVTDRDPLTESIIGYAIEVHRTLGPGLLENAYQECLAYELSKAGFRFEKEVSLPIIYKDISIDAQYRLDMIVDGSVIIELKAVEKLLPVHEAQLLTYMKLTSISKGLLINFNVPVLKEGIKRRKL